MRARIVFILLLVNLVLASCGLNRIFNSKTEGKIIGRWDIQSISSSAKPDSMLLKDFNYMLHTLLINAIIEFSPDHNFNAQIAGKYYGGSWKSDSKAKTLRLKENLSEVIYTFRQVSENEIELTTRDANQDYIIKLVRPAQGNKQKR
jgi:hypothetical protein